MEEFEPKVEPKKKIKIINKEFLVKYTYILVLAVLLIGGISYSYTFFTANKKIASGTITTANLTINFSNRNINATGLSVPTTDQEGLSEFSKELTITNATSVDGKVELSLTRTSGLNLSDLRYALIINGAIQEIDDVPTNGKILSSAIMGNETVNVEVRLWPKTTYVGSTTNFVGELTPEISYLGNTATDMANLEGKYVNFNCSSTCEVWRIVKVEDDRLVLTRQSDYTNATARTNSNKYNPSLTFNDNSMITSVSTDNLNVYLAKTVKINGGSGTQTDPYTLVNNEFREEDKKVIATITYKDDNNTTVGTQNVYYNETNYISQVIDDADFTGWTDGTNDYAFGDVINFTTDTNLTAKMVYTLLNKITKQVSTASYIASYADIITQNPTFTTQDQVLTSAPKQTVYYYTGNDAAANANVLFAGYCWQIIRTTDNGGVRMIYNGVAVNNKCETTRTVTKGINCTSTSGAYVMSDASLFGRSYDYDLDTGEFTIENSTGLPTSWTTSDANSNGIADYKELIGTYTCLSGSTTCTTLYYVGSYYSNTHAYIASYVIGDTAHYSQLGTSGFNANLSSLASVGYMFKENIDYTNSSKSGEYFANAVWENGAYTLSSGNSGTAPDATHHYICDTDCTKVRYYFFESGSRRHYYILLENGKTVKDILKEMINYKTNVNDSDENINVYNSAMKGYLDNWYKKNLTAYTNYLDSTSVYCNDRSIRDLGGWNPSGTSLSTTLQFKHYSQNSDLNCINETDRFAVTNSKANLSYPIGLLTEPEKNLMKDDYAKTGQVYFGASPYRFYDTSEVCNVSEIGIRCFERKSAVRGVVTLKPNITISGGTGTYTDPYIVGPLVTRTN